MKSCAWKYGAAYSRRVPAVAADAPDLHFRKTRGGLMGRWVSRHRFVQFLSALMLFVSVPQGFANPRTSEQADAGLAQASAPQTVLERASPPTRNALGQAQP